MTAIATPPLTFIFPRELSYLSRVAAPHRIAPFFLRDARSLTRESLLLELRDVSDFYLNSAQFLP